MQTKEHRYWMQKAIHQAEKGKTPFGAVIVNANDECIEAYNTTNIDGATAHAEINVIRKLNQLHFSKANNLRLYSTVEPCPMCMSAIIWANIGQLIYGASIEDASKFGKQIQISSKRIAAQSWYDVQITPNIEVEKCKSLLEKYFG